MAVSGRRRNELSFSGGQTSPRGGFNEIFFSLLPYDSGCAVVTSLSVSSRNYAARHNVQYNPSHSDVATRV